MRKLLLAILVVVLPVVASGQQVLRPVGSFNADTIKIGVPFTYTLVHRHAAKLEVILPGTNYNFSPFELVRKDFYPTYTQNGISIDSAVYTLRTFDTKAIQSIALPVFVLQG